MIKESVKGNIVINQPAGHLERNESLLEAVIREMLEETQYEFKPTGLLGVYRFIPDQTTDLTYIRYLFCGTAGRQFEGKLDEGIISAEWMSYAEIKASAVCHRSPMVMQCIEDFMHRSPCSLELLSHNFA